VGVVVDTFSPTPPYQQIAADLRRKIASAELGPGAKLPSERELAAQYEVSRPTARLAIAALQADGQVITVPGRGAYVRERPVVRTLGLDLAERRGPRGYFAPGDEGLLPTESQTTIRRGPIPGHLAPYLHLESDEETIIRDRTISAEGKPLGKAVSYFPLEIAERTVLEQMDTGRGGVYARLEDMGHSLYWRERVRARPAAPPEARALELRNGAWVLTAVRVTLDLNGHQPLEVMERVVSAEQIELAYTIWP
jgi:GntR family transcriptional regulator